MMEWRPFLARVGVAALVGGVTLTLAVFMGIRLAAADPPGPTRDALTFAGVLRSPPTTPTPLVFEFTRAGTSPATCTATTTPVTFDSTGAFCIEVPVTCPTAGGRAFFNGDPITYTVRLASDAGSLGELLTDGGVAITPVPYARFADQVGVNNDCPAGYERILDPVASYAVICHRGEDQVVRVGTGATAFWIDRFEASVWSNRDTSGTPFFLRENDFPATAFPKNGQWRTPGVTASPVYASSRYTVMPSRFITWFQASEACAASGKRLPTGEEWLRAAQGTVDPGDTNGDVGGRCRTGGGATEPRNTGPGVGTGLGTGCVSGWGAVDMIGNVWEWTSEWYASSGQVTSAPTFDYRMVTGSRANDQATPWPTEYRDDRTWNITSVASRSPLAGDDNRVGMPSAVVRGGDWNFGTRSGTFSMMLASGPSGWDPTIGFRCVIPR